MSLDTIATLLSQRLGLDAKIMGDRTLTRAVEIRRVACRLPSVAAYLQQLQNSAREFDELVEQLVVPETFFFRDRKPFDFLVNSVRSTGWGQAGTAKLRVLSAPCATGEEPYSIAIALLEAGLSTRRFTIDAIDISRVALGKAQQGIYGKNSFRGPDWVERSRYFQGSAAPGVTQYTVCPAVRNAVNFQQGNLLEVFDSIQLDSIQTVSKYDIIFCRNLLIYLEPAACLRLLSMFHRLLAPEGLLFVGAAETGKIPSDRFAFLRQSFTFAYRKIPLGAVPLAPSKSAPVKPPAIAREMQPPPDLDLQQVKTLAFPIPEARHYGQ